MPRPRKPETQALGLRIPVTLAERVRVAAEANGRTWNAQVVRLIEAGFEGDAEARAGVAETWGHSLARSAATAAADAARDAVLMVARQFEDDFASAKARDAVLMLAMEREREAALTSSLLAERRANADRRAPDDAQQDPDPDLPLPAGVVPVDLYQTDSGVKVGRRSGEQRRGSEP